MPKTDSREGMWCLAQFKLWGSSMADHWQRTMDGYSFRFFSPEQVDEILSEGLRRGRWGSHAAIERILKLEPGVERAELWRQLRRLKFPSNGKRHAKSVWSTEDDQILATGYHGNWSGKGGAVRELLRRHPDWRPHIIWKHAAKLRLIRKISKRGQERSRTIWSEHENEMLLSLAGYKTARAIAKMLHRSETAVRCHLTCLGKSSRVHLEGVSRQALAADLHLGKKTVQRLIVEGLLEVRDPRITRESLESLRRSGRLCATQGAEAQASGYISPTPNGERGLAAPDLPLLSRLATSSGRLSRAERVWGEVAQSLGVPVPTIKTLIAHRVLKLYDPTVTEKSLRNFCRRYGSLINHEFLDHETREWLQSSMDLMRTSGESASRRLLPLRKHARIVRQCTKCGHAIRGNVFFNHIKRCGPKVGEYRAPTERGAEPELMYCAAACSHWRRDG